MRRARRLALANAGNNKAARMPMMAMTTNSSINVNARSFLTLIKPPFYRRLKCVAVNPFMHRACHGDLFGNQGVGMNAARERAAMRQKFHAGREKRLRELHEMTGSHLRKMRGGG
jgi:hypothetical protein